MVANIRGKIAIFAYTLVISAVAASGLGNCFILGGPFVKTAVAQELPVGQDDSDRDGLTDTQETSVYHTDPDLEDTDRDGYMDGMEVKNGYSPLYGNGKKMADTDTDDDGLTDAQEVLVYHSDLTRADTDGDSHLDGLEARNGYSPLQGGGKKMVGADTDQDYLNDAWEVALGTDLNNPDSDGDKYLDGTEVAASYDPLNPLPIKLAKKIKVSVAEQRLWYYLDDKLLETFLVSTGKSATPTPKGEFEIQAKVPVKHYGGRGFDYPNTKWNLLFARSRGWGIYIHGAYWHNNFGKKMSSGCVNVSYADMERLYWWAQNGTRVTVQ